jgi:hypothetical protein
MFKINIPYTNQHALLPNMHAVYFLYPEKEQVVLAAGGEKKTK